MKFDTALLHGGYGPDKSHGATLPPISQNTAFAADTAEDLEAIFANRKPGFVYSRVANPTVSSFERRIAYLEGGIGAVACNSGMAAVTVALFGLLQQGDELLSASGIFGGTHSLFDSLADLGIHTTFVPDSRVASFEKAFTEHTKAVFVESIGNPKLDVPDIAALAKLCDAHGAVLIVDATMATPMLYRPIALGAHLVIHSTSKFINGSSSAIGGVLIDGGRVKWTAERFPALKPYLKFGPPAFLIRLRESIYRDHGACMPPMHAYLNSIGLETMAVRMERICDTALKLATALQQMPGVKEINYPGLSSHPDHDVAKAQFNGQFGPMFTLRVGTWENAFAVLNALKCCTIASNIGDARTLVLHPASSIYHEYSKEDRLKMGVPDDLIRVSVGLEDSDDLLEDFRTALQTVKEGG
ncbi:MAG TPA: acetyl-L-homoserine sulfhydrolase [Ruminococcaceae bacterium]|nr:acetyl-L-homoserine sulfhydrolase [Oscillospiraceae bacterium]